MNGKVGRRQKDAEIGTKLDNAATRQAGLDERLKRLKAEATLLQRQNQ